MRNLFGNGDGWVRCNLGHRHWGRFGAAGLLLAGGGGFVLQHRAPWTHEGDRWGLPGGARNSDEDPVQASTREAGEEAAIDAAAVRPTAMLTEDHGGWSYTTVLGRAVADVRPYAANAESTDVRWCTEDEVGTLPLHHGFAAAWPALRSTPPPTTLVVDAVGASHAVPPLIDAVRSLVRRGLEVALTPSLARTGRSLRVIPNVILITDAPPTPHRRGWWDDVIAVVPGTPANHLHARQHALAGARNDGRRTLLCADSPDGTWDHPLPLRSLREMDYLPPA